MVSLHGENPHARGENEPKLIRVKEKRHHRHDTPTQTYRHRKSQEKGRRGGRPRLCSGGADSSVQVSEVPNTPCISSVSYSPQSPVESPQFSL